MDLPADVLRRLLTADPTAPRLTAYDSRRPEAPERIELSAKVLANWVAKASGALDEEFGIGPGSRVRLALPAHWRAVYWAYAVWSVGGHLVTSASAAEADAELTISDDPATLRAATGDLVLVTLPALARAAVVDVPPGAFDEVTQLASFGDRFEAPQDPAGGDPAWTRTDGEVLTYDDLADLSPWEPGSRAAVHTGDVDTLLTATLAAWAGHGSIVLSSGRALRPDELDSERVSRVVA